jgi:hypothetical protein
MVILLVIDRVEQNSGPDVEGESFIQVMCSGYDTSLKSGTQCDSCGCWFHNSCGKINRSAWGHLIPNSYCDVGRFFCRVFKF